MSVTTSITQVLTLAVFFEHELALVIVVLVLATPPIFAALYSEKN